MSHKPLPQKLEDDLNSIKHYKVPPPSVSASNENLPNNSRPFPRRRSMPNAVQKVFDDSIERSMYDEIFGHMLPQQRVSLQAPRFAAGSAVEATRQATTSSASSNSGDSAGSDFTTNLLQRLRVVEKEAKENREKLAAEVVKNQKLTEENTRLRRSSEEPNYALNQLRAAKKENESLKLRLIEMEEFLADYGLVWVGKEGQRHGGLNGSDEDSSSEHSGTPRDDERDTEAPFAEHTVSYATVAKAVQELNTIIYSEPAQVVVESDARKARLVQAAERVERMKVTFYRNGVMIKQGPFRPAQSPTCQSFLQDILDGYFPSEFREMYPDGVIFDLIDRHTDIYEAEKAAAEEQQQLLSRSQFLNKLPKTVLQNGNIVSVRNDIASRLATGSSSNNNSSGNGNAGDNSSHTSSNASLSNPSQSSSSNHGNTAQQPNKATVMRTFVIRSGLASDPSASENADAAAVAVSSEDQKDIVQVHIRWTQDLCPSSSSSSSNSSSNSKMSQKMVLQAAMFAYDTVLHLRQELALHFETSLEDVDCPLVSDVLELRTAYPPRVLTDDMTLREAGLCPNGTLHARRKTAK